MPLLTGALLTEEGFRKAFAFWPMFVDGLFYTICLSMLTVLLGFILALVLAFFRIANLRIFSFLSPRKKLEENSKPFARFIHNLRSVLAKFRPLNLISSVYVEVFRATPLLVQLFIVYYVVFAGFKVPSEIKELFGGIPLDRFIPGIVALSLNSAAYLSEIIRSGILSIDLGQTEAARSLGMSQWQNMRHIVLPQAIKNILPAIANEFVTIIKESSICYTIGIQEIMYAANAVKGSTYRFGEALIIAACVYFCITFPTSKIIAYFERRMSRGDKR